MKKVSTKKIIIGIAAVIVIAGIFGGGTSQPAEQPSQAETQKVEQWDAEAETMGQTVAQAVSTAEEKGYTVVCQTHKGAEVATPDVDSSTAQTWKVGKAETDGDTVTLTVMSPEQFEEWYTYLTCRDNDKAQQLLEDYRAKYC